MRRLLALVALALPMLFAGTIAGSAPAKADSFGFYANFGGGGGYYGRPYYGHRYHHRPYYGAGIVWAPPRVVYAPAPVYIAPRYVAPAYAAPVYAAPAPGIAWNQPQGNVIREGRDSSGNLCREYQSNAVIDGRQVPTYGTACLRADGQWQMVAN
jgi:hypothetical protein